jgi:hypothetical protein
VSPALPSLSIHVHAESASCSKPAVRQPIGSPLSLQAPAGGPTPGSTTASQSPETVACPASHASGRALGSTTCA